MIAVGLRWRLPGLILDMVLPTGVLVGLAYFNWLPGELWRLPENWFWSEWWLHRALEAPGDFFWLFAITVVLMLAGHAAACWNLNLSRLLGIRVVFEAENPPPLQVVLRLLGVILNILSLGLGYFWVFIHPRRLGWHDLISDACPQRTPN